jgi:hypothetical protein
MAAPGTVPAFPAPQGPAEIAQKMDLEEEIVLGGEDVPGISQIVLGAAPVAVRRSVAIVRVMEDQGAVGLMGIVPVMVALMPVDREARGSEGQVVLELRERVAL